MRSCTNALVRPVAVAVLATILSSPAAVAVKQDAVSVFPLSLARGSRLMIDAKINGRAVRALLDSAAESTFLD